MIFSETYTVAPKDYVAAGDASRKIKQILKKIGLDADLVRKASIAAYEAEINMVIHADGGKITLEVGEGRIRLVCADTGPGIEDIEKAMQEGYSTADEEAQAIGFGAGMGLPNIKFNSDKLDITSSKEGTTLDIVINLPADGGIH